MSATVSATAETASVETVVSATAAAPVPTPATAAADPVAVAAVAAPEPESHLASTVATLSERAAETDGAVPEVSSAPIAPKSHATPVVLATGGPPSEIEAVREASASIQVSEDLVTARIAAASLTLPSSAKKSASKKSFADQAKQLQGVNQEWNLPNERKKRKIVSVCGTGSPSILEGVAPKKNDFWDISISRLAEGTTSDKVKTYMQSKGIEVREAFVFPSKIRGTVSAKVRVEIQHKNKALDASNWSANIRVQSWIRKPKVGSNPATRTSGQNGTQ